MKHSWTATAYTPGLAGNCNGPDANDGINLYSSALHDNQGADWANLFPDFFPGGRNTNSPTSKAPTKKPTKAPTNVGGRTDSPTKEELFPAPRTFSPVVGGEPPLGDFPPEPAANNSVDVGVGIGVSFVFAGMFAGAFIYHRRSRQDKRVVQGVVAKLDTTTTGPVMCIVIENFPGEESGELQLKIGDSIQLIQRSRGGWWEGKNVETGECGLFPAQCVRLQSSKWSMA